MATGWKCRLNADPGEALIDLDNLFQPRGSSTPAADTGFGVGGVDFSQRWYASAGPGDRISFHTKFGRSPTEDFADIFRMIDPPAVTLTGPTSVAVGVYGSDTWEFGATSAAGLLEVRYQVTGHGAGAWAAASGASYSNSSTWSDPYASPSIADVPGDYLFYFEAKDILGQVGRAELWVTVT